MEVFKVTGTVVNMDFSMFFFLYFSVILFWISGGSVGSVGRGVGWVGGFGGSVGSVGRGVRTGGLEVGAQGAPRLI